MSTSSFSVGYNSVRQARVDKEIERIESNLEQCKTEPLANLVIYFEQSKVIKEYVTDMFPTTFSKEQFGYHSYSHILPKYFPQYFDLWWDPMMFNLNYMGHVIRRVPDRIEDWFIPGLLEKKYVNSADQEDGDLLLQYCIKDIDLWYSDDLLLYYAQLGIEAYKDVYSKQELITKHLYN